MFNSYGSHADSCDWFAGSHGSMACILPMNLINKYMVEIDIIFFNFKQLKKKIY